ncbi:PA1414 family protein [Pseudomonas sp. J452]|nr:PA1414 family protein [Pseudomonas sp. J452]
MKARLHNVVRQFLIALGLIEPPRLQPIPVRREPSRDARKPTHLR